MESVGPMVHFHPAPGHPPPPPPNKARRATARVSSQAPTSHPPAPALSNSLPSSPRSCLSPRPLSFSSLLHQLQQSALHVPPSYYSSFVQLAGSSPLSGYPHLFPPPSTTKRSHHAAAHAPAHFSFQTETLSSPLTAIAVRLEEKDGTKQDRLLAHAFSLFILIQTIMDTNTPTEHRTTAATRLLQAGRDEDELRDELIAQAVKQTTSNPSEASTLLGAKLLVMMQAAFPPSPPLYRILMSHVAAWCPPSLSAFTAQTAATRSLSDCAVLMFLLHHYHCQAGAVTSVMPTAADVATMLDDGQDESQASSTASSTRSSLSANSAFHPPATTSKHSSLIFLSNPLFSASTRSSVVMPLMLSLPTQPSPTSTSTPYSPSLSLSSYASSTLSRPQSPYQPSPRRAAAMLSSLEEEQRTSAFPASGPPLSTDVSGDLKQHCENTGESTKTERRNGSRYNTPSERGHGEEERRLDATELERRVSQLLGNATDSSTSSAAPARQVTAEEMRVLQEERDALQQKLAAIAMENTRLESAVAALTAEVQQLRAAQLPSAPPMAPAIIPTAPTMEAEVPEAPPLAPLLSPMAAWDVVLGEDAPQAPVLDLPPPAPPAPPASSSSSGGRNDIAAAIRAAKAKREAAAGAAAATQPATSSAATDAPPPPAAPTASVLPPGASDMRADLLAAIRAGPRLRKISRRDEADGKPGTAEPPAAPDAPPPPAPPLSRPATGSMSAAGPPKASGEDSRDALLAAIRAGPRLRKVSAEDSSSSEASSSPDAPPPPAPPSPPSLPSPSVSVRPAAADPRSDLLAAIRAGPKLRKVSAPEPAPPADTAPDIPLAPPPPPAATAAPPGGDMRSDLLKAIQGGVKLRKVTPTAPPVPADAPAAASDVSVPPAPAPSSAEPSSRSRPRPKPFDLSSALSAALQRRQSRLKYDTMRTLTSPLSASLTASPTHRSKAPSQSESPPPLSVLPSPDHASVPPPAVALTSTPTPSSSSSASSPPSRDELLAAIRAGSKLRQASTSEVSRSGHERNQSSLGELVGVASAKYHQRVSMVSGAEGATGGKGVVVGKPGVRIAAAPRVSTVAQLKGAGDELAAMLARRQQKMAAAVRPA